MINTMTPEGFKAIRLLTFKTRELVEKLCLPPLSERQTYSKGELCLMATRAGLTPRDFLFGNK